MKIVIITTTPAFCHLSNKGLHRPQFFKIAIKSLVQAHVPEVAEGGEGEDEDDEGEGVAHHFQDPTHPGHQHFDLKRE
jgi:hypothetical protein